MQSWALFEAAKEQCDFGAPFQCSPGQWAYVASLDPRGHGGGNVPHPHHPHPVPHPYHPHHGPHVPPHPRPHPHPGPPGPPRPYARCGGAGTFCDGGIAPVPCSQAKKALAMYGHADPRLLPTIKAQCPGWSK
jgi:hypothetical protein